MVAAGESAKSEQRLAWSQPLPGSPPRSVLIRFLISVCFRPSSTILISSDQFSTYENISLERLEAIWVTDVCVRT